VQGVNLKKGYKTPLVPSSWQFNDIQTFSFSVT